MLIVQRTSYLYQLVHVPIEKVNECYYYTQQRQSIQFTTIQQTLQILFYYTICAILYF